MQHHLEKLTAASSWCFLFLGEYTVSFEIIPKWFVENYQVTNWGYVWFALFQVFFLCAIVSHIKATFLEPGYTPKFPVPADIPIEKIRYCEKCDQWKPDRTHHCRACKRCIHRMDHHCHWINNCVGAKNQKFFVLFLLYVFLCCFLVLSLDVYIIVLYAGLKDKTFKDGLISLLVGVFTSIFAVVFLVFTAVMFYDQIEAIFKNQTEVEKLAGKLGKSKLSKKDLLKKALGPDFFAWINPFQDSPEPDYEEALVYEGSDKNHSD